MFASRLPCPVQIGRRPGNGSSSLVPSILALLRRPSTALALPACRVRIGYTLHRL